MAEIAKKIHNDVTKMYAIGVTGTNGKTTITHLIRDVFEFSQKKIALIGTNGCYLGKNPVDDDFTTSTTPESSELWRILENTKKQGADSFVMEVSSHALAYDRVYGIDFDVGVFSNLTQDHLDFHKTMENYLIEKEKLLKNAKALVINTQDKYGKELYRKYKDKSISVGFSDCDISAKNIQYEFDNTKFIIKDGENEYFLEIKILGEFSVLNALCAYAACKIAGIKEENIITALKNTTQVRGRCERINIDDKYSIIIDYAHSPDGLSNILKTLKYVKKKKLITVFGCGGNRDKNKREIMGEISGRLSDFTIITSDNPRDEEPIKIIEDIEKGIKRVTDNYKIIPDRFLAIGYAMKIAEKDDIILLAGKGHEEYIINKGQKIHFN